MKILKKILCMGINIIDKIKKIDLKLVLIIILAISLLLTVWFRSNPIDSQKEKLNELHKANEALMNTNDSLIRVKNKLDSDLAQTQLIVTEKEMDLIEANEMIKMLKNRRAIVKSSALNLSADEVSEKLTRYLKDKHNNE